MTADVVSSRCDDCSGACCTGSAGPIIDVFESDLHRLAGHLGLAYDEMVARHVTPSIPSKRAWVGTINMVADARASGKTRCTFLSIDDRGVGRCSVYESRPDVCRVFDPTICVWFVPIEGLRKKSSKA